MSRKTKAKINVAAAIIIILILVIAGVFASYEIFFKDEDKDNGDEGLIPEIDDRISPYTNQGLMVEILRIRHRGLLDKIMKIGTSWKNKPAFYYILNVDGKECNSMGNIGEQGIYTDWDTFGEESLTSFYIKEEQEKSKVEISIIEQTTKGLIFKKTLNDEKEKITMTYDYRTGRWDGKDDSFLDSDGYGHYVGDSFEIWFNIYQSDYDHDGIPYWTEVNILETDPTIDDSKPSRDPDNDGIPSAWEWRWGYDPNTWNDHMNLDPDIDGIENIEEYQMEKRLADPYQPDIYIEADGMEKKGLIDLQHIFYKESQQMVIERMCQHGVNVYIDDGWPDTPVNGGGEMLPFHVYLDDVIGKQLMKFYEHNFPDERKGIFRYLIAGYQYSGFITTSSYNMFDAMHIGNSLEDALLIRKAYTPRTLRITFASCALHELGHSMGLLPITFEGNDILGPIGARYPSMNPDDYEKFLTQYHSVMNYKYTYEKTLFDYSDGSNGAPYDQNDWDLLYLPTFEQDAIMYEEPVDETFEDFEESDEYPGIILEGWEHDEGLTQGFSILADYAKVKNTECSINIYKKTGETKDSENNIRIYAKPNVYPVHAIWTLVAEGRLNSEENINIYSQQDLIDTTYKLLII